MALLAGALVPNRILSLLMPMTALFVTDLVLGFHNTMWAVYAAVGLTTMIGWMISKRQSVLSVTAGSLISIASFFFITNAAMWVVGFFTQGFYPTTAAGLGLALESGLPFLSNLLFTAVFFGSFHALRIWKPAFVKA
jgi:hypothetical protein